MPEKGVLTALNLAGRDEPVQGKTPVKKSAVGVPHRTIPWGAPPKAGYRQRAGVTLV